MFKTKQDIDQRWANEEMEIFRIAYQHHGKNVDAISQYLVRKNVSECVQYYYLRKKQTSEKFRQTARRAAAHRNKRFLAAGDGSNVLNSSTSYVLPTDLATRRPAAWR